MKKNLEHLDMDKFAGSRVMKSALKKILGGYTEGSSPTKDMDCTTGECIPTGKQDTINRFCTDGLFDTTVEHADGTITRLPDRRTTWEV